MNILIPRLLLLALITSGIGSFAQSPMENMLKGIVQSQKAQNIKSSDVEYLYGRIMINIETITYHNPAKQGRRRCVQKQTAISASFCGRISQSRVKLYLSNPKKRLECEAYTHCPVFEGSSKYVMKRDPETMKITESKEYPLQVSTKYLEQDFRWVKDREKYVVVAKSEAAGNNTLEGVNIEIKPYKPAANAEGATLAPLMPAYVLWITGGRDWKAADEPTAAGDNLRWNDIKEQLMPLQENVSLGIPYEINSPEKPERDGENSYQQLLWHDVKGFDDYLLNPSNAYGISASANRYYKDDYSESKTSITVTLYFDSTADIKLPPLEPVPEPELKPLEPINEEIPLAPLEPVK